jgi:hypothetical protein
MAMLTLARNSATLDFEFLPTLMGEQIGEVLHEPKILEGWNIPQGWLKYTPPGLNGDLLSDHPGSTPRLGLCLKTVALALFLNRKITE